MASCEHCFGTGRTLQHSPDCDDDLCALSGDMHSCRGELAPCHCALGRRAELAPGLRRCYWLAHPECQRRHPLRVQVSIRRPARLAPSAYAWLRSRLREQAAVDGQFYRIRRLRGLLAKEPSR
jgi:hypothetical protein